MTARHRVRKNNRAIGILVVPAAAALLVTAAVDQPVVQQMPYAVHQPHRAVSADAVDLAALALFAVPGAGVNFPPGALAEQDGGVWQRIQDVTLLTDRTRYPGDVTAASLDSGASWLTELLLARDPSTTVSGIDTGSFGGRVAAEALNRVAATGYDMSSVFAVFYGDSNTPGTGLFDRYRSQDSTFGSDIPGGAVPLPDGTYLRVNREYDPIAYFPRYLWNPVSWLQIAAGFLFEHSRLDSFDFDDPRNVTTVEGNVVTVRVNSPVMPLLMPLKLLGVPTRIIQALQDIMQPIVESTGMYESGKVGFLPTPQKTIQYLSAIAAGFARAGQRLAGIDPPDPGPSTPPYTTAPTTTSEIIDAMEARDRELNGSPTPTARLAAAQTSAPQPAAGTVTADSVTADQPQPPSTDDKPDDKPVDPTATSPAAAASTTADTDTDTDTKPPVHPRKTATARKPAGDAPKEVSTTAPVASPTASDTATPAAGDGDKAGADTGDSGAGDQSAK
ncbi:PE-PPE domain-containing protein [Mycolicibacterium cosmeticum]|uniref:PE-PPE-like protein n=1 Tax=Mycolicibacterium cosmeticum TaxID=258533 RepID=W9B4E1_MYCCO|nr:PE-PPE domain-containing protein [Mycolicibacterium cosmeticum]TLH74689.1 PE-PPE domain-containing protein [Mycolicibacterium cosmeticum]CDO09636.1 PE-PPE-like protein [Mycolicibacterium cosmeticum]